MSFKKIIALSMFAQVISIAGSTNLKSNISVTDLLKDNNRGRIPNQRQRRKLARQTNNFPKRK